jgi:hypothetical protein
MREQLIAIIQREGFDTPSACEMADRLIADFTSGGNTMQRYTVGRTSFTLRAK